MKTYSVYFTEPVCYRYKGSRFNQDTQTWEKDVDCEEWSDSFTFRSLTAAKRLIKQNLDKYKGSSITKTWANGDWENLGEIRVDGSNKTFAANTKQIKSNY